MKPSAHAWMLNVEERRKSLLAILSAGMPAVVWDNVPRGTAINCQYIEAASTTEVYQDRILGVTEDRFAPAYTIMFFTGTRFTHMKIKRHEAWKCLLIEDRPDSGNREFKHPDPMGWTRDHRGHILGAFYTILIGNPRRSGRRKPGLRIGWRLSARRSNMPPSWPTSDRLMKERPRVVSFKAAFARTEASDDATTNRGEHFGGASWIIP